MKVFILLYILCLSFSAFSFQIRQERRLNVFAHHAENPVLFKVNLSNVCSDLPAFLDCDEAQSYIRLAAERWTNAVGSDFAFDVEFFYDAPDEFTTADDGVNIIEFDDSIGDQYSNTTIRLNASGEILDADIAINIQYIESNPPSASYTSAQKQRLFQWTVLYSLGQALGLVRSDQVNPLLVSETGCDVSQTDDTRPDYCSENSLVGENLATLTNATDVIMNRDLNPTATLPIDLHADDLNGLIKIYPAKPITTDGTISLGDFVNIIDLGADQTWGFTVPEGLEKRSLRIEGVGGRFTQVEVVLPSGHTLSSRDDAASGGGKDGRFGFIRYAHPGDYFIKFAPTATTTVSTSVSLGPEIEFEEDSSEYVKKEDIFQSIKTIYENASDEFLKQNISLSAGDIHNYLFRVFTRGVLSIESTGDSDMIGDLCQSSNEGGGSSCSYEDDSGTDLNFKFDRREVDVGEYILSVREYSYGSAIYSLKYSFTENTN